MDEKADDSGNWWDYLKRSDTKTISSPISAQIPYLLIFRKSICGQKLGLKYNLTKF